MARCELTGKGPLVKNIVSHSHIATKRWVKPNTQRRRMYSEALDDYFVLTVATSALRTVDHVGGLDRFIIRQSPELLSKRARALQTRIRRRLAGL
ncbi:MAG: 50S ribosomal protein L28 [bacterium]|nr:50S ribosomal protein L28 [Myxococcales bacterium]MCB9549708.1 50S ribosomal protein L28 [Myxococcales bacterium]